MLRALAVLAVAAGLHAQPVPSSEGYVGSEACAACHRATYELQSQSGHAQALFPASEHPLVPKILAGSGWTRPPDFRFQFEAGTVRLTQGDKQAKLPIQWAFGSGDQAVTFVSQVEQERYVEFAFSWYGKTGSMALTTGHPDRQPASLSQAMGITYDAFSVPATVMACFQCHSTGLVELGDNYDIRPAELGVRCEVCHGPGRAHIASAEKGDGAVTRASIQNPKRMTAAAINEFCGACHRLPPNARREFDFNDPWLVRHQPPFLAQSRCFRESSGSLTCFTCHPPHEKLARNQPEAYSSKCVSCHESLTVSHPAVTESHDCIGCHMPKVDPRPDLSFTNHWIGVYGASRQKPIR